MMNPIKQQREQLQKQCWDLEKEIKKREMQLEKLKEQCPHPSATVDYYHEKMIEGPPILYKIKTCPDCNLCERSSVEETEEEEESC